MEKIDYVTPDPIPLNERQHGNRYPWKKWFDLKRFRLVQEQHYDCRSKNMMQQVRFAARRADFGVRVKIETHPDHLLVEVVGPW